MTVWEVSEQSLLLFRSCFWWRCARGAGSFAAVNADSGDESILIFEDLDYATECLLLTTVTSLAVGLE